MYKKQILPNGVRLLTMPMPGTKTFSILVMIKTGSRHETKTTRGLSHFVEHMLFKGTNKRPDTLAISSALDSIGGEFNAFTAQEYTGYYAKVDGTHAGKVLDVISDIVLYSKFDAAEIERERGVILAEVQMYENNPMIHIDDLFESCLYGDTPAGWDTIGTKSTIKNFQRPDFLRYVENQYRGSAVVVGLAGMFTPKTAAKAAYWFEKLNAGCGVPAFHYAGRQTAPLLVIKKQKTKQMNVSIGFRAYSYHHPDFYVTQVLATILGGSMSSRLFISVRERQGLAYQVHTEAQSYADSGYIATTVGTSEDKIAAAVRTVLTEHKAISLAPVSAAELKRAKDYLKGRTTLNLESSENVNSWYVKQELLHKEVLSPKKMFAKIDKVSIPDIRRVASNLFKNNNLNAAVIGSGIKEAVLKRMLIL